LLCGLKQEESIKVIFDTGLCKLFEWIFINELPALKIFNKSMLNQIVLAKKERSLYRIYSPQIILLSFNEVFSGGIGGLPGILLSMGTGKNRSSKRKTFYHWWRGQITCPVQGNKVKVTGESQVVVLRKPDHLATTSSGLIKMKDVQFSIYTEGDEFLIKESH
jgi:hypothetical protein